MTEKMIRDAYCRIRTIDQTIPDDVLDFMKDAALEALRKHAVSGRSEQLAIDALKLISTAHSEGWSRDIAKDALKEIANCH